MLPLLIWMPLVLGLLAFAAPWKRVGRWILIAGAVGHSVLTAMLALAWTGEAIQGSWLGLDATGLLFLSIASALFLAVSVYAVGYLSRDDGRALRDPEEGFLFSNEPEAMFTGCLLLFLSSMTLVCISRDMGLLWVAIEATTLVSAPLINYHRHHRSLEATWKYLLICSVGIALALLGNYFLAFAGHGKLHLNLDSLLSGAAGLDPRWLKAAFLLLLVGYGTKMGLAPMHTWLPDAHSEAPSLVSALLSGALLNCAFVGIMRSHAILSAAGLGSFSGDLLVFFGLLSMAIAAVFIINQADFKRMFAYSSVEHMGILSLGVGIGGLAGTGAMLHAINHSLAKGMIFLVSGHILYLYGSKKTADVRYLLKTSPLTGILWLAGFLAITGAPPFGLFLSKLTILKGILESHRWGIAVGYAVILVVIFVAMAQLILAMLFGQPADEKSGDSKHRRDPLWFAVPAIALTVAVLILGICVPAGLWNLLAQAATQVGGF